jgi:hypothetical protein
LNKRPQKILHIRKWYQHQIKQESTSNFVSIFFFLSKLFSKPLKCDEFSFHLYIIHSWMTTKCPAQLIVSVLIYKTFARIICGRHPNKLRVKNSSNMRHRFIYLNSFIYFSTRHSNQIRLIIIQQTKCNKHKRDAIKYLKKK